MANCLAWPNRILHTMIICTMVSALAAVYMSTIYELGELRVFYYTMNVVAMVISLAGLFSLYTLRETWINVVFGAYTMLAVSNNIYMILWVLYLPPSGIPLDFTIFMAAAQAFLASILVGGYGEVLTMFSSESLPTVNEGAKECVLEVDETGVP